MNLNPGKKHPEPMRDGWYYQNGQQVAQSIFSDAQHKQPNTPDRSLFGVIPYFLHIL
jgi:hypothetical protein